MNSFWLWTGIHLQRSSWCIPCGIPLCVPSWPWNHVRGSVECPLGRRNFLVTWKGNYQSRLYWMRSSYDFSAVVPESSRITYGGDSCVSDDMDSLYECYVYGDAANFRIGDTGMGIFLMVSRAGASSCWMNTRVPGRKGYWMGQVFFLRRLQVRPPSKQR